MRPIKFRAWNKDWVDKKMFYFDLTHLDDFIAYTPDGTANLRGTEIMQYTGLKDCKRTKEYPEGQEIYEGDIVNGENCCGETVTVKVQYETDTATFRPLGIHQTCGDKEMEKIEIIGNIYENPELIK